MPIFGLARLAAITILTAEKIRESQRLILLGFPAPKKWRTRIGLELWKDVLERSDVTEAYVPIEQLTAQTPQYFWSRK